jgi:predicted KAP-like P-loop ATPase
LGTNKATSTQGKDWRNEDIRLIVDSPIDSSNLLDFDKYSNTLSNIILNSTPRLTIGVFGSWGTGKTSLMRMVEKKIQGDKVLTIWFNAWRYEREDQFALIPLMREISRSIEIKGSEFKKLKDSIKASIKATLDSTEVGFGIAKIKFKDLIKSASSYGIIGADIRTIYYESMSFFTKELRPLSEKGYRIVVFIDDLDRCDPDRSYEVLASIKSLLDTEGIIFVIGLSPETIRERFREKFKEEKSEYLEKLIQLQLPIPSWSINDLKIFLEHVVSNLKDKEELLKYDTLLINAVARNPRSLKRLLNLVIFSKEIFEKDIKYLIVVQALKLNPKWEWLIEKLMIAPKDYRKELIQEYLTQREATNK